MNRREFLKAGKPLKVCVFADLHFTPGVYTNDTPEFLAKIMARAERENCDMMIHAGDMVQNVAEKPVKELLEMYNGPKVRSGYLHKALVDMV